MDAPDNNRNKASSRGGNQLNPRELQERIKQLEPILRRYVQGKLKNRRLPDRVGSGDDRLQNPVTSPNGAVCTTPG